MVAAFADNARLLASGAVRANLLSAYLFAYVCAPN
jgi:hypothetical protein